MLLLKSAMSSGESQPRRSLNVFIWPLMQFIAVAIGSALASQAASSTFVGVAANVAVIVEGQVANGRHRQRLRFSCDGHVRRNL